MIFKSNNGKSFSLKEAIDLMVSLSATDANSAKKGKGFYHSLLTTESQEEWDEFWPTPFELSINEFKLTSHSH